MNNSLRETKVYLNILCKKMLRLSNQFVQRIWPAVCLINIYSRCFKLYR